MNSVSKARQVARVYAKSLASLASPSKDWHAWESMLSDLIECTQGIDALKNALLCAQLHQELSTLSPSTSLSPLQIYGINLFNLLLKERKLGLLPEILSIFRRLKLYHEDKLPVCIYYAHPLTTQVRKTLSNQLRQYFGKPLCIDWQQRTEILSGFQVQFQDWILDFSGEYALRSMRSSLMAP